MEKNQTSQNKSSQQPIQFAPLSDGLGFHPFSDGLPYAPVTKSPSVGSKKPMGTGAVSAGTPRFSPVSSPVTVPVVKSQIPPVSVEKSLPEPTSFSPSFHLGLAYVARRVFAFCLDSCFNITFFLFLTLGLFWIQDLRLNLFRNSSVLIFGLAVYACLNWFSILVQEVTFKTSCGKSLFGLRFKESRTRIFFRALLFPVSLASTVGFFMGLFGRQKRCFHDLVSGTQPLEKDYLR